MINFIKPLHFKRVSFEIPFFPVINIVSISGGKDSAATLLLALEQNVSNLLAVFADTGNEHEITYEYVRYLEDKLGVPIIWLKADFTKEIEAKESVYSKLYGVKMFGVNGHVNELFVRLNIPMLQGTHF